MTLPIQAPYAMGERLHEEHAVAAHGLDDVGGESGVPSADQTSAVAR
jgi:hypothetical protein